MNRAERRRYAKEVQRGTIGLYEPPKSTLIPKELVDSKGRRYSDLNKYLAVRENEIADELAEEISKRCSDIASEMLYKAEEYMAASNIIIMLHAVKRTFKNLKTVQNGLSKVLDNYNSTTEYVDSIGVKAAYDELHDKHGISIEFDEDFDMSEIFDQKAVYEKYKIRMNEKADGV